MAIEIRYLDVIWLDNLLINLLLLWIVRKLTKNSTPVWRLWCAACIGALYAVLMIYPGWSMLRELWVKLSLAIIMLIAAYRIDSIKCFLKLMGFFYGITFLFGGAALGLYFLSIGGIGLENGIFIIYNYPFKILFISSIVVIMMIRCLWPFIRAKISQSRFLYRIELQFDGFIVCLEAFLDTGNHLNDPISQSPVMVVEYAAIRSVLPEDIRSIFTCDNENNFEMITKIMANSPWINRFRMVPYAALGLTGGMLIGYKPDKARILINERWQEIKDVIVGICNQKLSNTNEYNALIHPQIIP